MVTAIIVSMKSKTLECGRFKEAKKMNKYERLRKLLSKGNNPPIGDMILFAFYLGKLSAAREIQKKYEEGINDIISICKGESVSDG